MVIASHSSNNLDDLHRQPILLDPTSVTQSCAPTSTSVNSPKACEKSCFRMLRFNRWVESRRFLKNHFHPLRHARNRLLLPYRNSKKFNSFWITSSHLFLRITCLHVSTRYASISFDRMIQRLWCEPITHTTFLLYWHHTEPVTHSRVATCPADVGIDFWPKYLIGSNFFIRTRIYTLFAPLD